MYIACNFLPCNLKGINDRLIHVLLTYNLFHYFYDYGCISTTIFLDCDLNYGFHFFLNSCCLMTLLRYLGVRSGAGAGAGAGTELEQEQEQEQEQEYEQEQKKTHV